MTLATAAALALPAAVTGAGAVNQPGTQLRFSLSYEQRYEFDDSSTDFVTFSSGHPVRLTRNRTYDGRPAWSPDGRELAFSSDRGNANRGVFVIAADGSGLRRLTPTDSVASDPAWSPDGRRLAYSNGEAVVLTDQTGSAQEPILETVGQNVRDPAWSPDGKLIAYTPRCSSCSRTAAESSASRTPALPGGTTH